MSQFSWQSLKKPFFVLAPMEDVTDTVFRRIIGELGAPDVYFTEFTNCEGLLSVGRERVEHRLQFTEEERPIIAQIWGTKPETFYEVAKQLVEMGFDGIDINMGCPEKSVVKAGACSALIKDPGLAAEIIQATKEGVKIHPHPNLLPSREKEQVNPSPTILLQPGGKKSFSRKRQSDNSSLISPSHLRGEGRGGGERGLPISVKTRIGFKEVQTEEWIGFLLEQNIGALTIHGRTVAEMSEVPAHWDEIGKGVKLRDSLGKTTLIIGNGDVASHKDGLEKAKKYGLDGIMVGRGIFHNPWLFDPSVDPMSKTLKERLDLLLKHVDLFESTWGTRKNYQILKKYFKIYIQGFDGASEMRAKLMATNNATETREVVSSFLNQK